jgi:hypothetical protein
MEMLLERLGRVEAAQERIEAGQSEAAAALRALERAERLRAQREAVFEVAGDTREAGFYSPIVGERNVVRVKVFMDGNDDADDESYSFPRTSGATVNFFQHAVRRAAGTDHPDYAALEPRARAALERHQLKHIKVGVDEDGNIEVHMHLASYMIALKPWDEWAAIAYEVIGDCLTQEGSADWLPGEAMVNLDSEEQEGTDFHLDVHK